MTTPDPPARADRDADPRDNGLYELARGVGALVNLVTDVAATIGAAVNQPRPPAARPINPRYPPPPTSRATWRTLPQEESRVPPTREPLVDLFDEGDELVLVLEWPEADMSALKVDTQDDVLALAFGEGPPVFELLLPWAVDPASPRVRERNGIAEIRMRRAQTRGEPGVPAK